MRKRLRRGSEMLPTLFIGKWTVKIIHTLEAQPHRHRRLLRRLGNVSQRMLTRTLRNLESAGLIARRVTQSSPIGVEYSLTELGRTFIVPLNSVCRWANRHHEKIRAVIRVPKTLKKQP